MLIGPELQRLVRVCHQAGSRTTASLVSVAVIFYRDHVSLIVDDNDIVIVLRCVTGVSAGGLHCSTHPIQQCHGNVIVVMQWWYYFFVSNDALSHCHS